MPDNLQHTDKELLSKIAEGDELAFRQLFAGYKDIVYSAAYRWLASSQQSEDIVQDVFMKLWQSRAALSNIENIKVYILVATKNHIFNAFKKNSRSAAVLKEIRNENRTGENTANHTLDYKETYSLLQKAIDQLPTQQKRVFTLGKLEGYKLEEIAFDMSISIVTVNKHMALAVRSVKSYLSEHDAGLKLAIVAFLFHQL